MRAGCAFRVILHTERRPVFQTDPFNGIIVQVYMRYFHVRMFAYRFGINTKAMVLRGNFTLAGNDIFYRVVQSPVAVMHFKSRNIIRQRQQLMAETNAKHWLVFFEYIFYGIDGIRHCRRIARAIGYKITARIKLLQTADTGFGRVYTNMRTP